MILNENDKEYLIKCSSGLISNDELSQIIKYRVGFKEFKKLLESIYESGDQSLFEAVLWCMPNSLSASESEAIYAEFILLKNHREHENIVTQFQIDFNENFRNVNVLLNAVNEIPDYLAPDDFKYPYIQKLVYAIGAQPEPYNNEALEALKLSNDKKISSLAIHQIEKRKKMGRWEAAKKHQ